MPRPCFSANGKVERSDRVDDEEFWGRQTLPRWCWRPSVGDVRHQARGGGRARPHRPGITPGSASGWSIVTSPWPITQPVGSPSSRRRSSHARSSRTAGLRKNSVVLIRAVLSVLLSDAVDDENIFANPALQLRGSRRRRSDPISNAERRRKIGGSLNANLHYHSLVLDGVYARRDPGSKPSFHATAPPSASDIADILTSVRVGIRRRLARRSLIRSETDGDPADPAAEEAPLLAACYAASVQGTVAMGPKAGHYVASHPTSAPIR